MKGITRFRKQLVAVADLGITIGLALFFFLVFPGANGTGSRNLLELLPDLGLLLLCTMFFQILFRTYDSLWRYAEGKEYLLLFFGMFLGYLTYTALSLLLHMQVGKMFMGLVCSCSLLCMLIMRFTYRIYRRNSMRRSHSGKKPLGIIGAGVTGVALMEEIQQNERSPYKVCGFFDDDREKIGKSLRGVMVKGPLGALPGLLENSDIRDLVIAIPTISSDVLRPLLKACQSLKCRVKILPDATSFLDRDEKGLEKQIRDVRIDDLLGRDEVWLTDSSTRELVQGKTVLVTGGGGSIGSELCRQIARRQPKTLIVLDIYENNAYDLQQELRAEYGDALDLRVEIASVRDEEKIDEIFLRYQPDVVLHAAAHKHVPLMESCPGEAIKNNIFGTYNVVQAADKAGVRKFVLISTDKAVNPTNVMGATKRFCEMILQSMKTVSRTEYVAVRFGNVLGSNGSVVPLFQKQIAHGGPVTVTDKRVIRYFMTIPEAAQLVLCAGSMAGRSEIYVLDMGDPVSILELAENLIRLSGYTPYQDIAIEETGLRPGEKLYEELLTSGGNLRKTANRKIFIESAEEIRPQALETRLQVLRDALETDDSETIRRALKSVVPTYHSPEEVNSAQTDGAVKAPSYLLDETGQVEAVSSSEKPLQTAVSL